jgi:tetratricopeptide (TPR) repeat protein
MKKDNILFGVAGLAIGLFVGFWFANSVNQTGAAPAPTATTANSDMPAGHPEIGQMPGGGATQPAIQETIDAAKSSPGDFNAQMKAAVVYYQIGRFDEAIDFLKIANKLKPADREAIVALGNANFDAEKYDEAEKWYTAALAKKSDDVSVRTDLGLLFVFRDPPNYDRAIQEFNRSLALDPNHIQTLQNLTVAYTKKNDAAKATATLTKLESVDPQNAAIKQLKDGIAAIGVK